MESYSEERRPVFMETGEGIIANGIKEERSFLERYSPERDQKEFERAWQELEGAESLQQESYEPHYEGSSVVIGPPNSTCGVRSTHSFEARPGHHLAPQPLSSGRNVFEELGSGFTLLAFGVEKQAIQAIQRAAKTHRLDLNVVRDSYEEERKAYESRLVLVRPDQYVAWAGDEPPLDAAALMKQVTGNA